MLTCIIKKKKLFRSLHRALGPVRLPVVCTFRSWSVLDESQERLQLAAEIGTSRRRTLSRTKIMSEETAGARLMDGGHSGRSHQMKVSWAYKNYEACS